MVPDPYSRPEGCPYHPRCDYMMPGKCDRVAPPPVEIGEERVVRCLLYDSSDVSNLKLQDYAIGNG
jgi:ABC-type dipeptide/oligopeptide/nickel transport system ATPase component